MGLLAELYIQDGLEVPLGIQRWQGFAGVHPQMVVLPMGFSWSFHLAQCAHEHACEHAVPDSTRLVDKSPAPPLSSEHSRIMLYADNANHLALRAAVAEDSRIRLSQALNEVNLSTHEIEGPSPFGTSLGIRFDGNIGLVAATPERDSLLDQGLLGIIGGIPVNSDDVRRVVGHITVRMLL